MTGKTLLRIRDLEVGFDTEDGRVIAVDQVSFDLKHGQILGLVGESGCGKSVTALSVMRLLPRPSGVILGGSIEFNGQDLLSIPIEAMQTIRGRKISMIFQEPMTALNPVHTVGRQISEVYHLHFPGMTAGEISDNVIRMLSKVGISGPESLVRSYPHQLSGGMRQRVMIAMALASRPDILIADEPTTALDVTVQAQILDLIKELQAETAMAVLLITHDLGVIAENCDETVVMYGGQVAEKGRVASLFESPRHPYTRGLLASIPALSRTPLTLLPTIHGMVPSLDDMPSGCRFSTRCPQAREICNQAHPPVETVGENHQTACYFPGVS